MLQNMDQRVLRSWQSIKVIKSSYKGIKIKNYKVKEPKAKSQLLASQQLEKVYKKAKKEKKKDRCNCDQNCKQDQKIQKSSTLMNRVNALETQKLGKKQKKNQKQLDWDLSTVTYYNFNKKHHYLNSCPKLSKN